jgi:peptidoglycan/xylan/chitin deacetylase (PgdA/CDA1 family)
MINVVQCWDDGIVDDIRLCEILRAHGARATFNLNPGLHELQRSHPFRYNDCKGVLRLARGELRECYDGFEIANHSRTHPFPRRITLDAWQREVFDARKELQDLFGQEIPGFVYPYGETSSAIAEVVRSAGHTYARTTEYATPCFPPQDPMFLKSDCHHAAGDFWEKYELAKSIGSPVFYFWGHSYEFVTEDHWREFEAKIRRISADPAAQWTDLSKLFAGGSSANRRG